MEEGGSIFAISGVRGRSGGGLVAVGAGPAQLLKFARGDLIRLSFEEGLSEQVAVLIDDWLLRVGRALGRLAGIEGYRELDWDACTDLDREARFGVRQGVGWVRHLSGSSRFLDRGSAAGVGAGGAVSREREPVAHGGERVPGRRRATPRR